MEVEFLQQFEKDIDKIRDQRLKLQLKELIEAVEEARSLKDIRQTKKLTGLNRPTVFDLESIVWE